eukprot:COSAG02_NODE_80_length_40128_cov_591.169002_15_plen_601_part_00
MRSRVGVHADILSLNHCAPRHTGRARARNPRRARSMHPDAAGRQRPRDSGRGRAIFSARHPGIPMNSYWISVLILNLPDFSELGNWHHHTCIRGTFDHMCTPTRESHCGGLGQVTYMYVAFEPAMEPRSEPEPEPEPEQPPPTCWICLGDGPNEIGERPQQTGCACRGGATTHAHVGCLARFAQEKAKTWHTCPTCDQPWSGPMRLTLAQRRHELAARLPEESGERMNAAGDFSQVLREVGEYEQASQIARAQLATTSRQFGREHPHTLSVMQTVVKTLESFDPEAALALQTELLATYRRVLGSKHEDTLRAIEGLAITHQRMNNNHLALPLWQEAVTARRQTLGNGALSTGKQKVQTLNAIRSLAGTYANLCENEMALPLFKEALKGKRQLLGNQHEGTVVAVGNLGQVLCHMGDHATAAPLLQEAVEGLSALGVGHDIFGDLERFKMSLELNACSLADPADAAEHHRKLRQRKLKVEASLPKAAATVYGVQSRPQLNGTSVTIRRFLIDKGRCVCVVLLPRGANCKREKILLKPANLVLVVGSAVVATGLTGAPELNGRTGKVEEWDAEAGRYVVRLEGERQLKRLKPENCRANVLAL